MSEPWGDNRMPEEGCEFCSVLDDDRPDVCWECPHDPDTP